VVSIEERNFFCNPMVAQTFFFDSQFTQCAKSWLNLSEHICSIPGQPSFKHNYQQIFQVSPTLTKVQQVFIWVILAAVTYYSAAIGIALGVAISIPKLAHRGAVSVSHLQGLKNQPLLCSHEGSAVSCTYPGGRVGHNICDWTYQKDFTMIFDGVGHKDERLVKEEHPLYLHMAQSFEKFLSGFNYNQEKVSDTLKKEADAEVEKLHQMMHQKHKDYELRALQAAAQIKKFKQELTGKTSISETQVHEIVNQVNIEKVGSFCEILHHATPRDPGLEALTLCYESLRKLLNSDKKSAEEVTHFQTSFEALMIGRDPSFKQAKIDFFAWLKHKEESLGRSGPAFGVAHVFQDKTEQRYLYTSHVADISFLIIKPPEGASEVTLSDVQEKHCEWISESADSSGLGSGVRYSGESQMRPVPKGSLIYSFTDGVGEFLSRGEILEVIRADPKNIQDLAFKLERKIRDESHHKIHFNDKEDESRQRACNIKRFCKKLDPSGLDTGCVDDFAVTCKKVC